MEFEWDDAKALSNAAKHGVTFDEGLEVFADPDRRDAPSRQRSDQEARRYVTGRVGERLLTVIYTLRSGRVRLISARPASAKERRTWRLSEER